MKLIRSFIKGRMNKSVDERLVPEGEYIDARNVRVGNTETTDIGSLEKTKGNTQLTALEHRGQPLSSSAICLGAFQDGANDTIYWFVHDPVQPLSPTNKVDLIVSYNVINGTLDYHVVSEDDGGGVNTALNFNPTYLINGINLIDNFLFFTDNFNQPKRIDINRSYWQPGATPPTYLVDPTILYVIKAPPLFSPSFELFNQSTELNYLEDRFLTFAYRWKYTEDEYSAVSPFTTVAFEPEPFRLNTDNYTNDGMLNRFNAVRVSFNTGGEEVKEIEVLFKYGDDNFIRIAERINKADLGLADNITYDIVFDNSKTYTFLPTPEIGRLFDNVPRLAKAQTIMGNRLMYGNYLEGYDLVTGPNNEPLDLSYFLEYNGNEISFNNFGVSFAPGQVNILSGTTANLNNQIIEFDMTDTSFEAGTQVYFRIEVEHAGWFTLPIAGVPPAPANVGSGGFSVDITYTIPQYYATVNDFAQSPDFLNAVGTATNIQSLLGCANGGTLTDVYNCNINVNPDGNWQGYATGYLSSIGGDPIEVISTAGSNTIGFRILAANFLDTIGVSIQPTLAEYLQVTGGEGYSQNISSVRSLHSDRNYEVGIEYLDEFGRASTVLASPNNAVYIPCVASRFSNRIVAKIPPQQRAPNWAKHYRFLMKQDRFRYQTIYSTNWYDEVGTNAVWMQLEGENQAKIQVGDFLRVKGDVKGPIGPCCEVEVLDKQVQPQNFLSGDVRTGAGLDDPIIVQEEQGVYMKIKPDCFSTVKDDFVEYTNDTIDVNSKADRDTNGYKDGSGGRKKYLFVNYEVYNENGGVVEQWPVAEGANVEIYIEAYRAPQKKCKDTCGARQVLLDVSITSSASYQNLKEFFEGEGLVAQWKNSPNQTIECIDDSGSGSAEYYDPAPIATGTGAPGAFVIDPTAATSIATPGVSGIQFFEVPSAGPDPYLIMRVAGGYAYCPNRKADNELTVMVRIVENPNVVSFETLPIDTDVDIYYEGSDTYNIDAFGNHLGIPANGDTNQDGMTGASGIINLSFFNCYAFGNGVESYRILDSISKQFFLLGQRTNIAIDEDYKALERFAGITYSGTYQDVQNINRLNEFNITLGNYKRCEQAFGDIEILDGRETDLLVLQEDKISYVQVGKNLLSDAIGGGAVTSVPEVLGKQIARVEQYGISHNPESYVQWGAEKFFTDAKRGVALKLTGQGQSESLSIISDLGMDSWFRDLFRNSLYKQKLGGYDPYMDEYVLHSNDIDLPFDERCEECNVYKTLTLEPSQEIEFCISFSNAVGEVDIDYDVTSGEAQVQAIYDGATFTGLATVGAATLTFTKNDPSINQAIVKVTNLFDGVSTVQLTIGCVQEKPLEVIMICLTSESDQTKSIHNEYGYNIGSVYFSRQSESVVFGAGTTPIISQYQTITGNQGQPNIPTDGSTITVYCNKISPDSFNFDPTSNGFKWLRSATLYPPTPTGIANLLAVPAAPIIPIVTTDAPQTYSAVIPTLPPDPTPATDPTYQRYLYLIYDYRNATEISLCYEPVNIYNVCC